MPLIRMHTLTTRVILLFKAEEVKVEICFMRKEKVIKHNKSNNHRKSKIKFLLRTEWESWMMILMKMWRTNMTSGRVRMKT